MNLDALATSAQHRSSYQALVRAWPAHAGLACSGGPDSTAALLLAAAARRRGEIAPFIVLHIDHAVRPESPDDARFVAGLAADLGLPSMAARIALPASPEGRASEAALRLQRYAALGIAARRLGLQAVVTAHTREDQVETVLLRLIHGAAPLGATGMQLETQLVLAGERLRVVRPLLDVRREQLVAVLEDAGIAARLDPSNEDLRYRRNAIRHTIVPRLAELAPGFDVALLRSVTLAARDADYVDQVVATIVPEVITDCRRGVAVNRRWLRRAHPALASRVVRAAALRLIDGDSRELDFERTESVVRAAAGRTGAVIQLPYGIDVHVERELLVFEPRSREDSGS